MRFMAEGSQIRRLLLLGRDALSKDFLLGLNLVKRTFLLKSSS